MHILTSEFFNRDTHEVAKDLLGKVLYHRKGENLYRAVISETEAYHGTEDLACHCSKGKTPRTEIMFGEAGYIYIYLIYGMYQMLNFVTMPMDFPAAVLIRGVKDAVLTKENNSEIIFQNNQTNGPGKLTQKLQIGKELNKKLISPVNNLWVCDNGIYIPEKDIHTGKRIGIDYAKEWRDKAWRFYID